MDEPFSVPHSRQSEPMATAGKEWLPDTKDDPGPGTSGAAVGTERRCQDRCPAADLSKRSKCNDDQECPVCSENPSGKTRPS